MLLGRGDRDMLAVPVLPGAGTPSVSRPSHAFEPEASEGFSRRIVILGGAAICVAGIAAGTLLLSRSPSHAPAVTTLAPVVVAPARVTPKVVHHRAQPSAAQVAQAAAQRVAAHLAVSIEGAALIHSGSAVYVVGGTTRLGKPSAAEYKIDLATGRVQHLGTFVEPLTGAGAAVHSGALYLAGGWTGEKAATAVLRWTPGASSSLVARLPVPLRHAQAAFSGSTLYVWSGATAFAVDVASGKVTRVAKVPASVPAPQTNLAYLIAAERK